MESKGSNYHRNTQRQKQVLKTMMLSSTPTFTSPTAPAASSAAHLLALLSEPDRMLQSLALAKLIDVVDTQWHEISDRLADLEALAEPEQGADIETRQMASAVASRVFFHLEEPIQALRLALEAGEKYFNLYEKSLYNEAMLQAAMEVYTNKNSKKQQEDEQNILDEEKLRKVVQLMFDRCYRDGCYGHALGGELVLVIVM